MPIGTAPQRPDMPPPDSVAIGVCIMGRKSNKSHGATATADTTATAPTVDTTATAAAVDTTATATAPTVDQRAEKRARDAAVRDAAVRVVAVIATAGIELALCDAVLSTARRTAGKDIRTGATAEKQGTAIKYARAAMADVGGVPVVERILSDAELCLTLPGATISGGYTAGAVAGALIGVVDTVTSIRRAIQGK